MPNNKICRYCGHKVSSHYKDNICTNCRGKLPTVKTLYKMLEPARQILNQRLIESVEYNLSHNLPVTSHDYLKYLELKGINKDDIEN